VEPTCASAKTGADLFVPRKRYTATCDRTSGERPVTDRQYGLPLIRTSFRHQPALFYSPQQAR